MALAIISMGLYDCVRFRKITALLEEIVDFTKLLRNEISYRKASYPDLIAMGKKREYRYILFENKLPSICVADSDLSREFNDFTKQIGTTDSEGQIALCIEYGEKFSQMLKFHRDKERSKIQVNLSLSLLGAFSVIIIFI